MSKVDLEGVERAIAQGFELLRFPRALEAQYQSDIGEARCARLIRQNYVGLVVYNLFLFTDAYVIRDVFALDLLIHAVLMTPLAMLTNLMLARRPPRWLREGAEAFVTAILAATIVVVVCASAMPDRDLLLLTLLSVVLFMTTMQAVEFFYAAAGCVLIAAAFVAGVLISGAFSFERGLLANSIMASVMVYVLFGSYTLEHGRRQSYLLMLRDHLRNRDLEIASLRDALTGIANRRALDAALLWLVAKCADDPQRAVSVLLLDIDHFKAFNDANGHQAGDACLTRVAQILAAGLRDGEGTVFRYGGEEFLILLDGVPADVAPIVAERLRANVARGRIARDGAETAFVTVSIGIASGRPGRGVPLEALIAKADKALYEAKRGGRNRIWQAPDAEPAVGPSPAADAAPAVGPPPARPAAA